MLVAEHLPSAAAVRHALRVENQRLTCARCGNFVAWIDEREDVCASCLPASLPEPLRAPLTVGSVGQTLLWLLPRVGPMALFVTAAFETPGVFLFSMWPEAPFQLQALYGLFTLVGELGVMVLANEVLHGRSIGVLDAIGRGLGRYGAVFVTRWVSNLLTLLWTLLFVIPGIYKAAQYSLAPALALFEDTSGSAAVDRSIERTKPHLLTVALTVGLPAVAGILWNVVVGMAYGIALAPELALFEPSLETDLLVTAAGTYPAAVFGVLATFAVQIVYVKTAMDARIADAPAEPTLSPAAPRSSLDAKLDDELRRLDP